MIRGPSKSATRLMACAECYVEMEGDVKIKIRIAPAANVRSFACGMLDMSPASRQGDREIGMIIAWRRTSCAKRR